MIELKVYKVKSEKVILPHREPDPILDEFKNGMSFSEKGKILAPHNVM